MPARPLRALVATLLLLLHPSLGRAQSVLPGVDDWSAAIVELTAPRWVGPRVPHPTEEERPVGLPLVVESIYEGIAVHAAPGEETLAREILASLERSAEILRAAGWPAPPADGGGGGTAGFDLYLVPGARAESHAEGRIVWSFLDATTPFATLDPALVAGRLDACVTQAYADAILLGMDPAEARSWRAATAAWLAWMVTGIAGCEDPHEEQQRAPWRGWFPSEQETLDQRPLGGGALLLAALSARHDRGTGIFVRELWQMSRQRTWEGLDLRAAPDLWMALETSFELVELEMSEFLAELAVSRYFTGARATGGGLLRDLAPETRVPIRLAIPWSALPAQSVPADPPLEPFGSGYVRVDVRDAPPGSLLRVWLRAEYGVEWSLQAVRLDGRRRELGRMRAPPRRNVPRSYLPVELEPGTETVLLVITNLSSRLPDADGIDENERSFRVILDRGAAGGG